MQNPFRINIGFLINQPIGYSREIPFELDEIEMGDNQTIHNLIGSIILIRNQDGFRSQAIFDGELDSECGRCLKKFKEKIHSEFEEFFTFPFVETSEDEIQVSEDGNVDFAPIVHDYLIMDIPPNPICSEDCKGLCDICGVDLNQTTCEHVHVNTHKAEQKNDRDGDSAKQTLEP